MRFFLLFATILLAIHGCKSPENPGTTPQPSLELPQSVQDLIYKSYPSASNLKGISEMEKDRVYSLSFEENHVVYDAIVSKSGVLRVATTMGEAVPDSLVAQVGGLAIRGGKLSNYRKIVYFDDRVAYGADYELNGVKYTVLFWYGSVALFNYESEYESKDIQDLPVSIQQYIAARNKPNPEFVNSLTNLNEVSRQYIIKNNELTFRRCMVQLLPDGSKQYYVWVSFLGTTDLPILFNEKGEILWNGSFNRIRQFEQDFNGSPALWVPNLSSKEITYFRDVLAGSSEFLGFNLDNFMNFNRSYRNEYENNVGYELDLYNDKNERWSLCYNRDKKLVYSIYNAY